MLRQLPPGRGPGPGPGPRAPLPPARCPAARSAPLRAGAAPTPLRACARPWVTACVRRGAGGAPGAPSPPSSQIRGRCEERGSRFTISNAASPQRASLAYVRGTAVYIYTRGAYKHHPAAWLTPARHDSARLSSAQHGSAQPTPHAWGPAAHPHMPAGRGRQPLSAAAP